MPIRPWFFASIGAWFPARLLGIVLLITLLAPPALPGMGEKEQKAQKEKQATSDVSAKKVAAKALKSLAKARTLREKGKAEMALVEFQKTIELDPSCAEAYLEMGNMYLELNIPQQAAQALETGIPLARQQAFDATTVSQALCQLADSYRLTGNPSGALEQAKTASDISPQDALPWKIMGVVHSESGKFDEARKALSEAVRLDSHFVAAWEHLGRIALDRKEGDLAQTVYEGLFRCDTFKAGLFKADMARLGLNAQTPVTAAPTAPAAGSADDPYAVGGVTASGTTLTRPSAQTSPPPRLVSPSSPAANRPRPSEPSPAKPTTAPVVAPKPRKPLPASGPALISLPVAPLPPKTPAVAPPRTNPPRATSSSQPVSVGPGTTAKYRSDKPLSASDTLLSEVMLPGSGVPANATTPEQITEGTDIEAKNPTGTTLSDTETGSPETGSDEPVPPPDDNSAAEPSTTANTGTSTNQTGNEDSTEPDENQPGGTGSEDPYAIPDEGSGSEPTSGDPGMTDDPALPGGDTESGGEPSLPMLPEDQAPAQPSPTSHSPSATPAKAEPSGSPTSDDPYAPPRESASGEPAAAATAPQTTPAPVPATEEIPEDRLFALFSNLSSPDTDVATRARKRLVGFGAAAMPHLIQKLNDQNPLMRLRLLQTLEEIGPGAKVAASVFQKLSQADPDPKVRQQAEQLVQRLANPVP